MCFEFSLSDENAHAVPVGLSRAASPAAAAIISEREPGGLGIGFRV